MMINIADRIRELNAKNGWTMYRLAQASGLAGSTLRNMVRRDAGISIYSLESICRAYGMTVSEFLGEGTLSEEDEELLDGWHQLGEEQKKNIRFIVSEFRKTEKH